MVPSRRNSTCRPVARASSWASIAAAALLACSLADAQPSSDIRLSRYTTTAALPEAAQADPLAAVVQLGMPRTTVRTVGEAIAYLLLRTGYRLAAPEVMDPQARAVLDMPLPEVHRRLGPYTVRTALSVLMGSPYVLSVHPTQRLVSYSLGSATSDDAIASVGAAGAPSSLASSGSAR